MTLSLKDNVKVRKQPAHNECPFRMVYTSHRQTQRMKDNIKLSEDIMNEGICSQKVTQKWH